MSNGNGMVLMHVICDSFIHSLIFWKIVLVWRVNKLPSISSTYTYLFHSTLIFCFSTFRGVSFLTRIGIPNKNSLNLNSTHIFTIMEDREGSGEGEGWVVMVICDRVEW
jgi:hypothetical protein